MSEEVKVNNLELWDKFRACPLEAQKLIGGGKLKNMTDINPVWRIKMLTAQYGPCGTGWYYIITSCQVFNGAGGESMAHVAIDLFVKDSDGRWSQPIQGIGGSMLVNTEKDKLVTNDEAFKMALTDAISVSCKALGMAADIYWQKDRTKYTYADKKDDAQLITEEDKKIFAELGISITNAAAYFKVDEDTITSSQAKIAIELQKKALAKAQKTKELKEKTDAKQQN